MSITKTSALLLGAAFIASLALGAYVLRDRAVSLTYGDGNRALLDDALAASMSLPTGTVLLANDLRTESSLAAHRPLWRNENGMTLYADGTWERLPYRGRWHFAGPHSLVVVDPDGRPFAHTYRWASNDAFVATQTIRSWPGRRPRVFTETFGPVGRLEARR